LALSTVEGSIHFPEEELIKQADKITADLQHKNGPFANLPIRSLRSLLKRRAGGYPWTQPPSS
jgi:hypothetical protein